MHERFAVTFLAVLGVASATACTAPRVGVPCFLGDALPPGAYRAEIFTMGLPRALGEVQARFAGAVAKKQEWFQAYVTRLNLKPGEPLPYAEEMEVSREEYEALTKAYAHPAILPLETIQIEVVCSEGSMRFRARPPHDFLDQMTVDAKGTLSGPMNLKLTPEAAKSRNAKFGTWSGETWSVESADVERGNAHSFELSIGRVDDSRRLFLYFNDFMSENKKPITSNKLLAWLSPAGLR